MGVDVGETVQPELQPFTLQTWFIYSMQDFCRGGEMSWM